jgi:uncharacterized protein (TIGR02996 family)
LLQLKPIAPLAQVEDAGHMHAPLPGPLEAALAAAPDAPAGYLVAADWLQAQGDPHGELISLMFDLEHEQNPVRFLALKARREALLALHGERWLGGAHLEVVTWRWGFVVHARLQMEHLEPLLASRAGQLVRELEVHGPLEELEAAFSRHHPALLRGLALVGSRRAPPFRLASVVAQLPALSRLGLFAADVDLTGLDPTGLSDLRLRDVNHPSVAPLLARLMAPGLTHLELSLDAPLELKTETADRQPALRVLRLEDDLTDDLACWAAAAPRSSRLARLALTGPMTDRGLDALLKEAARLQGVALSVEGGAFAATSKRLAHRQLPRLDFRRTRAPEAWWAEPGRPRPGPRA